MNSVGSMPRIFPRGIARNLDCAFVLLDTEGISIPYPHMIQQKINLLLFKEGHYGRVSIRAFFDDKISNELQDRYCEVGIFPFLCEGDRGTRLRMMLVNLLFWAKTNSDQKVNVLIITKDNNIGEDAKFSKVRDLLEKKDIDVSLAQPDTFLKLDGICRNCFVFLNFDGTEDQSGICGSCSEAIEKFNGHKRPIAVDWAVPKNLYNGAADATTASADVTFAGDKKGSDRDSDNSRVDLEEVDDAVESHQPSAGDDEEDDNNNKATNLQQLSDPFLSGEFMILDLQSVDDEIIATPLVIYQNSKTCVFWNVEDYPIPNGVDLESICGDIKKGLLDRGSGEVSIQAYVDRKSTDLGRKFSDAKIDLDFLPEGDDFARSSWMLVDILCWALANPSSNIMVLSKNMVKKAVECLESLYSTYFGVFLSKTQPGLDLPPEDSALFLTTLFDPKRQRPDTLASLVDPKQQRPDTEE